MGEYDYEKEYQSRKWNMSKNYNIDYDCVDKHMVTYKRNKIAFLQDIKKASMVLLMRFGSV